MKFYKTVKDGYIVAIFNAYHGYNEITEEENNEILAVIKSCPEAPTGYAYRLKTDLTWELYELPILEAEATTEDYAEEMRRLGVDV